MCVLAMVLLNVTADFMERLLYDRLRKGLSRYTMKSRWTLPYAGSCVKARRSPKAVLTTTLCSFHGLHGRDGCFALCDFGFDACGK